jgi:proline iminopeptidase
MNKNSNYLAFIKLLLTGLVFLFILGDIIPAQEKDNTGSFANVNGEKIWYQIKGKGEPIVLIPGGPGNSHLYLTPWFDELSKNFKVVYFDAFGRGKSSRAENKEEYSFQRDVNDLEGLRKALGFDKWSVLGHSYGGMVAQAYAIHHPGSVDKLILSDTFYDAEMWQENDDNSNYEFRNQCPEKWEKLMKIREQGYLSSSPEHVKAYKIPSGLLYFYNPENALKMRSDSLSWNLDVYYQIVGVDGDFIIGGDIGRLDFRRDLKNLKMPVLILAGRYDRISDPRFAVKYKMYAPQAEFVMFEKSGHNPYVEEHDRYFRILNDFLKGK